MTKHCTVQIDFGGAIGLWADVEFNHYADHSERGTQDLFEVLAVYLTLETEEKIDVLQYLDEAKIIESIERG